jgi:hypothetical protein
MKPFLKIEHWDKKIFEVFFDLETIHQSICGFSKSTSKSLFTFLKTLIN